MTTFSDATSRTKDAEAIARIKDAARASRLAEDHLNVDAAAAAQNELCRTVLAANDLGVSWQTIGDALGIARGNAYQRHRRRPGA